METHATMRGLPAVHRLLSDAGIAAFEPVFGREFVKAAVAETLERARAAKDAATFESLRAAVVQSLESRRRQALVPVINGTGVLLHTNLGRAPLSYAALEAISQIGHGYSNLEFDLSEGTRASRYARVNDLLLSLTGAQDALVVNNCAAAMLLVLDTFAKSREVIVARNQLVEIGGGFRVPDVLERSGARLVEVGATNKVYVRDFERALTTETSMILRTHPSNYRIVGFVEEPSGADVASLAKRCGIPCVEDLGTGALLDLSEFGLPHERTVREAIGDGIDIVAFSGDKLLGGPQAGIILGKAPHIARLRNNPLLRALRVDKATLAALGATLAAYASGTARETLPLYRMLGASLETLRERAGRIVEAVGSGRVEDAAGSMGGGSLPDVTIPSVACAFDARSADESARALRAAHPALVPYVSGGALRVDLRTILPEQDAPAIRVLREVLG